MREDIAIIGLGGIFPDAMDFSEYWSNILKKKDSVKEITDEFWNIDDFYDSDRSKEDKTYGKAAGIVNSISFDPLEFGMPPKVMQSVSVEQLFSLIVAKQALIDAGMYGDNAKNFDKARTGVIMSAGVGKTAMNLHGRTLVPGLRKIMKNSGVPDQLVDLTLERFKNTLNDWDEASNPGYLPNVVPGRIANRFNFGGTTCSVNAACGSSLASIKYAVTELLEGNCDVMLAGGVNLDCSAHTFISFSKTQALSKTNKICPFDENADGMVLGDGVGIVVLKRLPDAKRDNDRIYALIKGVGSSSDGKSESIFAPSKSGQVRAIKNALKNANVPKKSISFIEAHGTGTAKGDACESDALSEVFNSNKEASQKIILSSVKSQIGHLRLAAGIAGLIKAALALYHKNYPPSINVKQLNSSIKESNLYVLEDARPWISNSKNPIRRAGISAFGFGGTNFHAILEEAESEQIEKYRLNQIPEEVVFSATTKDEIIKKINELLEKLEEDATIWHDSTYKYRMVEENEKRLVFIARSTLEVKEKCNIALNKLRETNKVKWQKQGIIYRESSLESGNKVVAMFSGQGSQYVNMFDDAACAYPEIRKSLSIVDDVMLDSGEVPISELIYPLYHDKEEVKEFEKKLKQTENTQAALATIESSLYDIAKTRGFSEDYMLGHSFGELTALYADQVFDKETLIKLSVERGKCMSESSKDEKTAMMAVFDTKDYVSNICKGFNKIYIANENSPNQIIVAGNASQLQELQKCAEEDEVQTAMLKVSCAFHSNYMREASKKFEKILSRSELHKSSGRVIANLDAKFYPKTKTSIVKRLTAQITSPVLFQSSVEKAYENGARVFVEFGPGKVLSALVKDILLEKEDVIVISINAIKTESALYQVELAFAQLFALGMKIKSDPYRRILDSKYKNKRTKSSHEVKPTLFHLEEKQKIIDNSFEAVNKSKFSNENEMKIKGDENKMSNSVSEICKLRELNASVFQNFIKVQNEQIKCISELLEKSSAKTASDRKDIFECVKTFQDNSMKAFEIYFEKQKVEKINSTVTTVIKEEPKEEIAIDTDEVPLLNQVIKEKENEKAEEVVVQASDNKEFNKIEEITMDIISEKTGYPKDMIEKEMELEADLGVDSIKRVEIFSEISDQLKSSFTPEDIEELSLLATIQEIIKYIGNSTKEA